MAVISTHTLNSVDGTHAGGIRITVSQITESGQRKILAAGVTDKGGRYSQIVDLANAAKDAVYEMVLYTSEYFTAAGIRTCENRMFEEVVVRFKMPDVEGAYHIPFMLAPNNYSVWCSS